MRCCLGSIELLIVSGTFSWGRIVNASLVRLLTRIHTELVCAVFSASNYSGQSNTAAFLRITGGEVTIEVRLPAEAAAL